MVCCSTSFNCFVVVVWFININCDFALPENKLTTPLQACTPSTHVCSVLELPLVPQFLNQAPPGAQQLSSPDFFMTAHLGHSRAILVAVTAGVDMQTLVKWTQETTSTPDTCICRLKGWEKKNNFTFCMPWSYLCMPASLRTTCARHHRCFHSDWTTHRQGHSNWVCLISWWCHT